MLFQSFYFYGLNYSLLFNVDIIIYKNFVSNYQIIFFCLLAYLTKPFKSENNNFADFCKMIIVT